MSTTFKRPTGYESVGSLLSVPHRELLERRADPQTCEAVVTAVNLLQVICTDHTVEYEARRDQYGGWQERPAKRYIRLTNAIEKCAPHHEAGAAEKVRKAARLLETLDLVTWNESNTGGRPSVLLVLNLQQFSANTFTGIENIRRIWRSYSEPIIEGLIEKHYQERVAFYETKPWIAKIDFDSYSKGGTFHHFKKGDTVPAQICAFLEGTSGQPDLNRIEPLGKRVVVACPHNVCPRCNYIDPNHGRVVVDLAQLKNAGSQKESNHGG